MTPIPEPRPDKNSTAEEQNVLANGAPTTGDEFAENIPPNDGALVSRLDEFVENLTPRAGLRSIEQRTQWAREMSRASLGLILVVTLVLILLAGTWAGLVGDVDPDTVTKIVSSTAGPLIGIVGAVVAFYYTNKGNTD